MIGITWSRMATFVEVASRGSVRAAAAALQVTEPAVSASVSALEKQLGCELVAKEGRGIRLTGAGETYAGYCRTILALMDEAAHAVTTAERPRLRIGAVSAASEYLLPTLLVRHRESHPHVDLTVIVRPRDELFAMLQHHECDVVIAGRPPRGSGLVTQATRANRLVVIGSPERSADPYTAPWLLRGEGSGMRESTLNLLRQLEIQPELIELGTHGAVVSAARAGLGVTLAHEDAVTADLEAGRLRTHPLAGVPIDRPWIVSSTPRATTATKEFVRALGDAAIPRAERFHLRGRPHG